MKETIQFIEEARRNEELLATDYRTTIMYFPSENSLECKKYQNNFFITDNELTITSRKDLLNIMREDNAVQVFRMFYEDNFITKE